MNETVAGLKLSVRNLELIQLKRGQVQLIYLLEQDNLISTSLMAPGVEIAGGGHPPHFRDAQW